jgi:cell division septal protein FtsQ
VQVTNVPADRRRLIRRLAVRGLLAVGVIVTFLGGVLVVAAWTEDISIERNIGVTNAEVVADSMTRTVVRFYTPDGAEHVPQTGVLYPSGLEVNDRVEVEFKQDNPELVRVAGRSAVVMLLPVGLTLLAVWAVLVPSIWALRRAERRVTQD